MKHRNATVSLTAGSLIVSLEQLVERYAHLHLDPFWSNAVIVAASTLVLWVGRDGLRGALKRVVAGVKSIWTGAPSKWYVDPAAVPTLEKPAPPSQ